MIVLGIDPGLRKTGWGVVVYKNNSFGYLDDGFFLQNDEVELGDKLLKNFNSLITIINKFEPELIGIEQTFVGAGNVSSLKLGMARGVYILAAAKLGKKIIEIPPKLVKKNITGSGAASKDQVKHMIKKMLNITPKSEDSSDALGVAMSVHAKPIGNFNENSSNKLNEAINKALQREQLNIRK